MASKIVPLIPPHTVYVEPFAGGAAVFYAKPKPYTTNEDHYREVLNDINGELVQMYIMAKSSPKLFSSTVEALPFSRAIFEISKQIDLIPRLGGIAKYIKHNQGFAAGDSAFARGAVSRNCASSFFCETKSAYAAAQRLQGVILDCEEAVRLIHAWDSPHTFFYVDPPYLGTNCRGMGTWTSDDALKLSVQLNSCRGSWIVSGYNEMRGILRHERRLSFAASCSAAGSVKYRSGRIQGEPIKSTGRERTEQLYMRGPTAPVRSSLIPVLEKQTCFTGPLLGPCPLPLKTHPSARR